MVTSSRAALCLFSALCLAACGEAIDPEDMLFFRDGEAYTPEGLLCGLAYQGSYGEHVGGSCQEDYDPALEYLETGVVIAAEGKEEVQSCPDWADAATINDHDAPRSPEYGSGHWMTCAAESNAAVSSAEPRDLPAGAVCGLGAPRSLDEEHWVILCDGKDPSKGECPDGFEPRWIPDAFNDGVDPDTCKPDDSYDPALPEANALFFCVVKDDVGCTSGDCLAPSRYTGLVCGLHARGDFADYFGTSSMTLEMDELTLDYDRQLYDYYISEWFEYCSTQDAALGELIDTMRDAVTTPTCMGQPIDEGCPDGLELVCSPGWHGDSDVKNVALSAMCYCTTPGARQRLPERLRNFENALSSG